MRVVEGKHKHQPQQPGGVNDSRREGRRDQQADSPPLREDLVAARTERREGLSRLQQAGDAVKLTATGDPVWDPGQNPALQPKPWPTRDELDQLTARIDHLKADADRIIRELRDLGVDSGLFKLNGD